MSHYHCQLLAAKPLLQLSPSEYEKVHRRSKKKPGMMLLAIPSLVRTFYFLIFILLAQNYVQLI